MKNKILPVIFALASGIAIASPPPHTTSEYAVRRSTYPRILPGNRAEFRIVAPDAQSVKVDIGNKYNATRGSDGAWYCITDSLGPGFHYYFIDVDGARVADPASETFYGCGVAASGIEIPYPAGDTRFSISHVPHGETAMRRYYSTPDSTWKQMMVYTPPCYHTSPDKTYPVLYLQHGGGEDQRGWCTQGRADIILDNLIAAGMAKPMVIVMCDGNSRDFTNELIGDCIPLVESTYCVDTTSSPGSRWAAYRPSTPPSPTPSCSATSECSVPDGGPTAKLQQEWALTLKNTTTCSQPTATATTGASAVSI